MPLVKKRLTINAGATSDQVLAGTTYEYISNNTNVIVAAQDASSTYEGKTNLNFNVNNSEFARDALVSEKVTGEAFGNPHCVRISYATSEEQLTEALKRIKEALA